MKILVILALVLLIGCTTEPSACINNQCFDVEIADTSAERSKGLMGRESLDLDKGMLFIFDRPALHSFWMKNTLIPLDIVWIDRDLEIVYIEHDVQPCEADPCPSYGPDSPVLYVLEVNSGLAADWSIGTIVKINDIN